MPKLSSDVAHVPESPSPLRFYTRFVTIAISGVLLLATLYTLYFAREFAIPVVAAAILGLVFAPLVRLFSRYGIPSPLTGGLIVLSIVGALTTGLLLLSEPTANWLNRAPMILSQLDYKLRELKRPVEQVKEASDRMEKLAQVGETGAAAPDRNVVVKPPGILQQIFGTMQTVLIQLSVTLVLLFFLIAAGDIFKIKLVQAMRRYSDKKRTLCIWRDVEHNVSIYLVTIALINIGLGIAIAFGLYSIGLPNALLWGAMAILLNFIPYLGALVGLGIVSVVSIITFDSLGAAMLAPAIYAGCNLIESQLVTPAVLGRRLALNPVIVFISVIFWGWLWGMPGAMMAVPMLIVVHVACSHIPSIRIIAELLTLNSAAGKAKLHARSIRPPSLSRRDDSVAFSAIARPAGNDPERERRHDDG